MKHDRIEKGQYVTYGTNGICLVADIRDMSFVAETEKNKYYVLEPVSTSASTIFVPAGNQQLVSNIRPLMTKKEIDSLLLMISCIYMKKRQLMSINKKLPTSDSNTLSILWS